MGDKNISSPRVIYIAGSGRSGSTLLDIIIGNNKNCFSTGELMFFVANGILEKEYCSCGKLVISCKFWGKIIDEWKRVMSMSLDEYRQVQIKYLRNRQTLLLVKNNFFPSVLFKKFLEDTRLLYQIISNNINGDLIIDSSKNAHRILILKKIGIDLTVVRISRKFSGVLNSNKKSIKKDLKRGVEKNMQPQGFLYVLFTWCIDNFLAKVMSLGVRYYHLEYENLIKNPIDSLRGIVPINDDFYGLIKAKGPFLAKHLVAGNALRMSEEIHLSNNPLNSTAELNKVHRFFAKIIDLCQLR